MSPLSETGDIVAPASGDPGRRARFLQEMGVGPLWTLRARDQAPEAGVAFDADRGNAVEHPTVEHPPVGRAPARAPGRDAMPVIAPAAADIATMDWPALRRAAGTCTACGLCKTRTQVVFGDGDEQAQWLFVSSAATRDDDTAGLPLAGARGALMNNMLRAAGLNRIAGTYLTPAVKCRAVDGAGRDRAPTADEAAACRPFLDRQIALLAPAVIVAMGDDNPLNAPVITRGQVGRIGAAALVVMADPHTLLGNPAAKADAWADLCLAKAGHVAPA